MPTRIPGCVLWLRADLGITIGTGVQTWTDQIAGRAYTQATGSKQPTPSTINGQASLRFTASSSQSLATSLISQTSPFDIFIVCQATSPISTARGLYDTVSGTETGAFFNATTNLAVGFSATINDCTSQLHTYRITYNGASSAIYQDGTLKASGNTGTVGGPPSIVGALQGTADPFDGWISELLIYGSVTSAGDAEQITQYIGRRYGILVS